MSQEAAPKWQEDDSHLFDRLKPLTKALDKKPVYSLLVLDKEKRETEKLAFFDALEEGEDYLPDLTPTYDEKPPVELVSELRLLRNEIKTIQPANEQEQAVKNAYRWRVNSLIGNLRIAEMAKLGDMRNFKRFNKFVYGSPDPELVAEELAAIRADAEAWLDDPEKQEAAQDVLDAIKDINMQVGSSDFKVTQELFDKMKEAHQPYLNKALDGLEVPEWVEPAEGMELVRQILANLGADQEPHNIKVAPTDSKTASVNNETVNYPQDATYSRMRFTALYVNHEIGDHVYGKMLASESEFMLARKGLDRVVVAKEARGVIGEQLAYDSPEEFNVEGRALTIGMRHLTVALAIGVDGKPRNFTEVYKIAEPIFRMYSDRVKGDSKEVAYDILSQRTMKGTAGRGAAFLKDYVYAEGVRKYWKLAQDHPELLPYWRKFQADLSNPRHIAVLQTLGVLPTFTDSKEEIQHA